MKIKARGVKKMATETFDKTIWLDEKAAEILASELEKPKSPYITGLDAAEVERSAQEWWKRYQSKKLSKEKKNNNL